MAAVAGGTPGVNERKGRDLMSWLTKDVAGAARRGCMTCGAHVLLEGPAGARCSCCGGRHLASLNAAAQEQHGRERRARPGTGDADEPVLR
ncbi:MAG: hypothetical protein QOK49_1282 [Baekduia sp.]|nr:hypothetical protein [Baekduia sp.]